LRKETEIDDLEFRLEDCRKDMGVAKTLSIAMGLCAAGGLVTTIGAFLAENSSQFFDYLNRTGFPETNYEISGYCGMTALLLCSLFYLSELAKYYEGRYNTRHLKKEIKELR
jgi:hypothetical protein